MSKHGPWRISRAYSTVLHQTIHHMPVSALWLMLRNQRLIIDLKYPIFAVFHMAAGYIERNLIPPGNLNFE